MKLRHALQKVRQYIGKCADISLVSPKLIYKSVYQKNFRSPRILDYICFVLNSIVPLSLTTETCGSLGFRLFDFLFSLHGRSYLQCLIQIDNTT